MKSRLLPAALFAAMALAALLFTPLTAGFALRPTPACELNPSAELWLHSLNNIRHLVTYSILTAVAVWAFGRRALPLALATSLLVTVGVELTQAVFTEGHCRLRDMLPNAIAVAAGTAIAFVMTVIVRRLSGRTATI